MIEFVILLALASILLGIHAVFVRRIDRALYAFIIALAAVIAALLHGNSCLLAQDETSMLVCNNTLQAIVFFSAVAAWINGIVLIYASMHEVVEKI